MTVISIVSYRGRDAMYQREGRKGPCQDRNLTRLSAFQTESNGIP